MCICAVILFLSHRRGHASTHAHACTHAHTHTHSCTQTHTHIFNKYMYIYIYIYYIYMCTYTHTYTHIRTNTRTEGGPSHTRNGISFPANVAAGAPPPHSGGMITQGNGSRHNSGYNGPPLGSSQGVVGVGNYGGGGGTLSGQISGYIGHPSLSPYGAPSNPQVCMFEWVGE